MDNLHDVWADIYHLDSPTQLFYEQCDDLVDYNPIASVSWLPIKFDTFDAEMICCLPLA